MKRQYEDASEYQADAYRIDGWQGVAWSVLGWEIVTSEEDGFADRTGNLVAVMIGDDRHFSVDPDGVHELTNDAYCHECGQIGCHCDAR